MILRRLDRKHDLARISNFLVNHYKPQNRDGNWFYAIWEYSYTLWLSDTFALERIGIWEDRGEIVAATLFETCSHDVGLCVHPEYRSLRGEMLAFAERNLSKIDDDGLCFLHIYAYDFDADLADTLEAAGYERKTSHDRPMSRFVIADAFPSITLPDGFRFRNLADHNDFEKVNRALHRGFDHTGEPSREDLEGRKLMQIGPNFMPYLTTAVEAPDGNWVSYCGMWYDRVNRFGYVGPVATDPDYRRMGLGTAAVLESIRKCGLEGADTAYVWTDKPFYLSFGFEKIHTQHCWSRRFECF